MNVDRLLGVALGERVLVGGPLDDRLVAHQRDVPVLDLRVEEPRTRLGGRARRRGPCRWSRECRSSVSKPWLRRQVLRQVAEVPLADAGGGVALGLESLGQRDLVGRQPAGGVGEQHAARCRWHMPAADRQPAGEQRRPARRADLGRRVELREPHALGGHAVEVRRADGRVAVAAEVAVAEVVGEDDDDVGRAPTIEAAPRPGSPSLPRRPSRPGERTTRNVAPLSASVHGIPWRRRAEAPRLGSKTRGGARLGLGRDDVLLQAIDRGEGVVLLGPSPP